MMWCLLLTAIPLAGDCRTLDCAPKEPGQVLAWAQECRSDNDCVIVDNLARCHTGGCSPPCPEVRPTSRQALRRERVAAYRAWAEEQAKAECADAKCLRCQSPLPASPAASVGGVPALKAQFVAQCRQGACVAVEMKPAQ